MITTLSSTVTCVKEFQNKVMEASQTLKMLNAKLFSNSKQAQYSTAPPRQDNKVTLFARHLLRLCPTGWFRHFILDRTNRQIIQTPFGKSIRNAICAELLHLHGRKSDDSTMIASFHPLLIAPQARYFNLQINRADQIFSSVFHNAFNSKHRFKYSPCKIRESLPLLQSLQIAQYTLV